MDQGMIEEKKHTQSSDEQNKSNMKLKLQSLNIEQSNQYDYRHALDVLQTHDSPIKGPSSIQDSGIEAEILKEKKRDPEQEFQEAKKNYSIAHKTNFSEIFHVVHKDEFEMLKIYTDDHPLLQIRKKILWFMKFISYLCFKIIKSKLFENTVLCIILFNTAVLIMVDPTASAQTPLQDQFDNFFLIAYTVEMSFKILGLGLVRNKGSYLRDGWNILDFVIVVSSLLPLILGGSKHVNLKSLRSLRILRPLRAISSIRALQVILSSIFSAIPFLIDIMIVLFFYFFVFAIAGLQLFRGALKQRCIDPSNGINYFRGDEEFMCGGAQDCNPGPGASSDTFYGNELFICAKMLKNPKHGQNYDNIFYSLLFAYQSATLEGWSGTMYWTVETFSVFTMVYHIVLVFIGSNVIINLTIAVISAQFSESQSKADANAQLEDQKFENLDQGEINQNQIENGESKQLEQVQTFDSEEEIIPNIKIMKKYSRKERLKLNGLLEDQKSFYHDKEQVLISTDQEQYQKTIEQHFDDQMQKLGLLEEFVNKRNIFSKPYAFTSHHDINRVQEQKPILRNRKVKVTFKNLMVPIGDDSLKTLLDDPALISAENNQIKVDSLAQAILFQRLSSLPSNNKEQKTSTEPGHNEVYNRDTESPIRDYKQKLAQKYVEKDHQQMQLIYELNQNSKNKVIADLIKINDICEIPTEKSIKVDRKDGKPQDYKLILKFDQQYYSSSKKDVLQRFLTKKEKETNEQLLKQIKDKNYSFHYTIYEESSISLNQKVYVKQSEQIPQRINEQLKNCKIDPNQSNQTVINGNLLEEGSQILQNQLQLIVTNRTRTPLTKGGQIRRKYQQKIYKQNQSDQNIKQFLQIKRVSIISDKINNNQTNKGQSLENKPKMMKQKKEPNIGEELYDLQSYHSAKKAFNEPFVEQILPFELPADKLYFQILKLDFTTQIRTALHWSGEQVLVNTVIPLKRANKIRQKLESSNQNKMIYLAGVKGYLQVKHDQLQEIMMGKFVSNLLLLVVIGNTVILSLTGTFTSASDLHLLETCNLIFTYIFISEMGLKLIAFGPIGYLKDKMNIFDGSIVLISIIEMTLSTGAQERAVSTFRAIRIFRVLRITRLLRSLKFMGVIVQVLTNTLENFLYITLLMFLFIIVYALLGMQIFGGKMGYRGNDLIPENWDNFLYAFLATFQGLTLENWDDLLQITLQSSVNKFLSVIYLVSWVFIGKYVFVNLFLAVLINGFVNHLDEAPIVEQSGTSEDENFMNFVSNSLLDSNKELTKQKKANHYLMEVQKNQINNQFTTGNQRVSLLTSVEHLDQLNKTTKTKKSLYDGIECESSLFIFDKNSPVRIFCYKLVTNHYFEQIILGFIIASSFKLALDTYFSPFSTVGHISAKIDIVINVVFICEASLKIIAFGFFIDKNSYLSEQWQKLDFFIVCTSIVDMLFTNVNIPVIKILRLLRILRPLRFISHNVNLKIIVIALFESMGGMINVIIVMALIWLMFAILGISLLGGKFGSCAIQGNIDAPNFGINIKQCTSVVGNEWFNYLPNMDNIYNAMIMIFVLNSMNGWPNFVYPAMNGDTSDKGPSHNINQYVSFYFVSVILFSAFVLINMFTGVLSYYYSKASLSEKRRGNIFLTQEQENWIEIQKMTIDVESGQSKKQPQNKIRAAFFWLVEQGKFDGFIMICICLNILTMAMDYEGSTIYYRAILDDLNLAFTSVFICEAVSKLIAFGIIDYISSGWNKFDLFVVTTSILDIVLHLIEGRATSILRVGPQLIRIIRVLRVTRLLKLIKSLRSLQKLLQTLNYSLPALLNIGALAFLIFFIFTILGVFLFQNQPHHDLITTYNNFDNFGLAMLTLYRASTGESWQWVMYDYAPHQAIAALYFTIFLVVSTWVMLNLFVLVIIDYFQNYSMKLDNPLEVFMDNLDLLRNVWLQFTQHSNGEKLHQKQITTFFQTLPSPMGFFGDNTERLTIAKEIMSMQLIGQMFFFTYQSDDLGNVYFNEILYAVIKRAVGEKVFGEAKRDLNLELQLYLIKVEQETRNQIETNKNKQIRMKITNQIFQKTQINPLVTLLYSRLVFLAWRNYSIIRQSNEKTPNMIHEEDCNDQSWDPDENQLENDDYDEFEPQQIRNQQVDDVKVEGREVEQGSSIGRPLQCNFELDEKYIPLHQPSNIISPQNRISYSGALQIDQKGITSRNFISQGENHRNQNHRLRQDNHPRIMTDQNNEDGLLENIQEFD